eukprot:TRINITY_DN30208_c0_g1_i1.p1 TRINITY_DN30208_c0_g1~~TRINITY_DN30208_c0_g1_i1.p1  ORF type:complete len:774 (+),score=117.31 TRINITY_DN30208_c0_g1_i1:204-2324(+)
MAQGRRAGGSGSRGRSPAEAAAHALDSARGANKRSSSFSLASKLAAACGRVLGGSTTQNGVGHSVGCERGGASALSSPPPSSQPVEPASQNSCTSARRNQLLEQFASLKKRTVELAIHAEHATFSVTVARQRAAIAAEGFAEALARREAADVEESALRDELREVEEALRVGIDARATAEELVRARLERDAINVAVETLASSTREVLPRCRALKSESTEVGRACGRLAKALAVCIAENSASASKLATQTQLYRGFEVNAAAVERRVRDTLRDGIDELTNSSTAPCRVARNDGCDGTARASRAAASQNASLSRLSASPLGIGNGAWRGFGAWGLRGAAQAQTHASPAAISGLASTSLSESIVSSPPKSAISPGLRLARDFARLSRLGVDAIPHLPDDPPAPISGGADTSSRFNTYKSDSTSEGAFCEHLRQAIVVLGGAPVETPLVSSHSSIILASTAFEPERQPSLDATMPPPLPSLAAGHRDEAAAMRRAPIAASGASATEEAATVAAAFLQSPTIWHPGEGKSGWEDEGTQEGERQERADGSRERNGEKRGRGGGGKWQATSVTRKAAPAMTAISAPENEPRVCNLDARCLFPDVSGVNTTTPLSKCQAPSPWSLLDLMEAVGELTARRLERLHFEAAQENAATRRQIAALTVQVMQRRRRQRRPLGAPPGPQREQAPPGRRRGKDDSNGKTRASSSPSVSLSAC